MIRKLVIAAVNHVLDRDKDAGWIGIRLGKARWQGALSIETRERGEVPVRVCASSLALRLQLIEPCEGPVVLLYEGHDEPGRDVEVRLWHGHMREIRGWEVVRLAFGASHLGHGLRAMSWVPDVILPLLDGDDPTRPTGGVLSQAFIWRYLLLRCLDFDGPLDTRSLLAWSVEKGHLLGQLADPPRAHLASYLGEHGGPGAHLLVGSLLRGHGASPLVLGLVIDVLLADVSAAARAIGRFEGQWLAQGADLAQGGKAWAAAAREEVRPLLSHESPSLDPLFRAQKMLHSLDAEASIVHSNLLPEALDRRLEAVASDLEAALEGAPLTAVYEGLARLETHVRSGHSPLQALRMAPRLLAWLRRDPVVHHESFPEALRHYGRVSSFVDQARELLALGEGTPKLQRVFAEIHARATARREEENLLFGSLLAQWSQAPSWDEDVLGVEHVLDRVVRPLSKGTPVLVVVMSGLGGAAFRALLDALTSSHGWCPLGLDDHEMLHGVATLPTQGHRSRASLLCGSLAATPDERAGFRKALAEPESWLPVLFHPEQLLDEQSAGLDPRVRDVLVDQRFQVVCTVVDGVMNALENGIAGAWHLDLLRPLEQILAAAMEPGRCVVLCADHGHMVGTPQTSISSLRDARLRNRSARGQKQPGEVLLKGPRVTDKAFYAQASELVCYNHERYGYFGGATPQEVWVPICPLKPPGARDPEGFSEVRTFHPDWWALADAVPGLSAEGTDAEASLPDWAKALLAAPLFVSRRKKLANAIPERLFLQLFHALAHGRGHVALVDLGRRSGLSEIQVNDLWPRLQRPFNVDGYEILRCENDSLQLDLDLLSTQFEIPKFSWDDSDGL